MITSEDEARDFVRAGWGSRALNSCAHLVELLKRENERQNLVSRGSLAEVWVRHVADSAQLLLHTPVGYRSWVDVGAGAGFPGLVVAALRPDLAVTLIEPRATRATWLHAACGALQLDNCLTNHASAENVAACSFDIVSARAVARLDHLLGMTRHLARENYYGIFPKGRSAEAELRALPRQLDKGYVFHVKHSLTATDARIIVCQSA